MAKGALPLTTVIVLYTMCMMIGKTFCISCEVGSFEVNGGDGCELCHAGSFSSSAQATSCNLCAAGQYSSEDGSSGCQLCETGTFSRNLRDTAGKESA